ncbi:cysteine desulfurase [Methanosarcina sp. 2.H.T.1A.6]|uniref:cysteine desulfurase n=1 Tax=unclassified Methanosarcina TaxID=2644672 RepID=UPI0006227DA0|nr:MULTISPECIES: cysteine desulfurase [unclassified Methanosarcina]KKG16270.1 cysteine desulfurase [Methanosarcina sp. 2.H.T.1A.3]KKG22379.1 cysteine desulfurase [Methanosarcina sp. 2.H.T.1A.15]KKG23010.1 cysteine desulfurase [Methanosarcina sp. 2.H.T.1A.6]KKG26233.1 cysteine desulfurase [Methanosarcina sp. 2.H.T.1A.8]
MYDVYAVREDFPVLKEVVYLDSTATTQTPIPAVEAMVEYFYRYAGNHGRGAHRLARETTNHYEDARETVARFLNADPSKTVFTKNTTEGVNLVATSYPWEAGDHIITTMLEHHSNLLPWLRLQKKGVNVTVVSPDRKGIIDPQMIENALTDRTKLIAVTQVSNVFGSIQNVNRITKIARRNGVKTLIDGAQSAGHMPVDLKDLECDFFATAGHKGLLGPQGTGVLYIRQPDMLESASVGGGTVSDVSGLAYTLEPSPACFEAGTPNIPGVIGLGRAVEYVEKIGVSEIEKHEAKLSGEAAKRLSELEHVEVYGPENRAGIVPFNVKGLHAHDVALILDQTKKICVRSGHHCAIPITRFLEVDSTVRASFALYNTEEEVDILVNAVNALKALVS